MFGFIRQWLMGEEEGWDARVAQNAARRQAEQSERERVQRLVPDLLARLEAHFKDKYLSDGTRIKFELGTAPLGEDCVCATSPMGFVWVFPCELDRPGRSGYYVLGRSRDCRVQEDNLFWAVEKRLAC